MGRSCPVCHKVVQNLSSHLTRVHKIYGPERALYFQNNGPQNISYRPSRNQIMRNSESDHCSDFKLLHPFTCMIAGSTGCGKTVWVQRLLEHAQTMISPPPQRIVYCYSQWQPAYVDMVLKTFPEIEFVRGIPQDLEKDHYFDINIRNLIVIDDQMTETGNDKRIVNLFTKGSHHRNLSVIFMVQNIFHQGKVNRDISLNSHYMVIFKNPRDKLQILNLAKQMYPGKTQIFLEKYEQAVSRPYGYLFLDLKTTTPDDCRLRTNLFPEENELEQEPKFQQELMQHFQSQESPEMSRMQELQGKMNNILHDPFTNNSKKAREYTQLQNNFLRYKHKLDHMNEVPARQQPTGYYSNETFAPTERSMFEPNTTQPLQASNVISSPFIAPENISSQTPFKSTPLFMRDTEHFVTQTPMKYTSSPLTPPPSAILTPPESMPRKRPLLKLKNYMEGDPLEAIKNPKRLRRSIRVKERSFPYKYDRGQLY